MTCETPIYRPRALTSEIYVGAVGKWSGLRISDNYPVAVEGTVTDIRDASWIVLTIETLDGISRIRVV